MYPPEIKDAFPVALYQPVSGAAVDEGAMAVITASGTVKNAAAEADVKLAGLIAAVRPSGIEIRSGVFFLANSSASPLTRADRGAACYVEDSATVRKAAPANKVPAGIVSDVESSGVWVDMSPAAIAAATALSL